MFTWFTRSETQPPVLLEIRSSKWFIIVTVATAIFTDLFVYAIIVPVLPFALTSRAAVHPSSIQVWVSVFLAVYGAALLIAAPIFGWIADRISSRRWPMLLGLVVLLAATVMLCFGRSTIALTLARILQGISAGIVWVVGLALLVDTVGVEGIGEAMGYVGLGMSMATLVAPLLGGIVFAKAGYYAVFEMAFGIIVLDIFLRVFMVEKKIAAKWLNAGPGKEEIVHGTPREIQCDVETGVTSDQGKQEVQTSSTQLGEGLQNNLHVKSNKTRGLSARLPPVISLLASRRLLSALWVCTVMSTLYTAMDAILPLFVKSTFHWNSIGAGLVFLPIFVVSFSGPIVGKLCDKYGPRWFATVGSVVAAPSLILLRLVQENSIEHKVLLCGLLAILGMCLTLVMTPMMAEVAYAVEAKARRRPAGHYGKNGAFAQAYSLFNVAWALGSMIGPLLGGLTNVSQGWGTSSLILGCMSVITAIPAAIWTGGSIFKVMKAKKEKTGAVELTNS